MDSTLRCSRRDFSLAFKLSVVDQADQVERGELTYKKAQERYGIQGRSTVLGWLRRHGRQACRRPMQCIGRPWPPNGGRYIRERCQPMAGRVRAQ